MDPFLASTMLVTLAEIGDKTQLLALVLTARFRKPVQIILGIFVATIVNHALAALIGAQLADWLDSPWFAVAIGLSFVAMGLWTLVPDRLDAEAQPPRWGAFLTTLVAFFLAEIGDKTQLATVALGARFEGSVALVAAGTTLGMMLANVPVVLFGGALMRRIPLRTVHIMAAILFILVGLWTLASAATLF